MVSEDRTFSSEQLEAAMDHGLLAIIPISLLSLSGESYMIKKITYSGGSSSVFQEVLHWPSLQLHLQSAVP